jgi:nucleoside-triphosphatase
MGATPARILLEGRPGAGKTTVARRIAALLIGRGVQLAGFTTEEIRERGRRVGFRLETMGGARGVLAHVDYPGPPCVGRYGVDLATLERLAVPALEPPAGAEGVAIVDELGKMELASEPFRDAVRALFESRTPVVATVHVFRHPFTDALKARADVEIVPITVADRDELPTDLAARLA